MKSFKSTLPECESIHILSVEQVQGLETSAVIVSTVPDIPPIQPSEILARDIVEAILCLVPKDFVLAVRKGWKVVLGVEAIVHQGIAKQVLWLKNH
jgi:quinate dehydrogenase